MKFLLGAAIFFGLFCVKPALAFEVFRDENFKVYVSKLEPNQDFKIGLLSLFKARVSPNAQKCNLLVFNKSNLYQTSKVTWNRNFTISKIDSPNTLVNVDTYDVPSADDFANPEPRVPCINGQANLNLEWGQFGDFKIISHTPDGGQAISYYVIPPSPGIYEIIGDQSAYKYRDYKANSCGMAIVRGTKSNLIVKDTQFQIEVQGQTTDYTVNNLSVLPAHLCRNSTLYVPYVP